MGDTNGQDPWWGLHEVDLDETARAEIGPLRLWLRRALSEWWLAYDWTDEEDPQAWRLARHAEPAPPELKTERFAVRESQPVVALRPRPADRAVVARPRVPLRVLPDQQARIYVSAPLWVEIAVAGGKEVLRELASVRLSDTWFGSTTREGELAYALRSNARMRFEEMPIRAHRILTPVVIENRAADALLVERLNLPVPFLSVFEQESRGLWTECVHMLRREEGDTAELDVRQGPPKEAPSAVKRSGPRKEHETGHLFRAFGSLLGLG